MSPRLLAGLDRLCGRTLDLAGRPAHRRSRLRPCHPRPRRGRGVKVAQWAKGGALNASMIPLVQDLATHYRVTHVLWHQGESDFALKTDPARYKESSCRSWKRCAPMRSTRRFSSRRRPDACRVGPNPTQSSGPTGTRSIEPAFEPGSTRTSSWRPRTAMTTVTSRIRER